MQSSFINSPGIFRRSDDAMCSVVNLHFKEATILDATYGDGVFYKKLDKKVTRGDIRSGLEVDYIGDCSALPFANDSFDLVVIDPPFKIAHRRYDERYGQSRLSFNTEQKVTRLYEASISELFRVARSGVVIKLSDGSDGHRTYMRHITISNMVKDTIGLDLFDYCVIARENVPSVLRSGATQRFFQKPISYFLIWRFLKYPFRAVRFCKSSS